ASPCQNEPGDEGRRTTNTITEERIQNPRTLLRQLLRQEKRSAIHGNIEQPRKGIVPSQVIRGKAVIFGVFLRSVTFHRLLSHEGSNEILLGSHFRPAPF